MASVSVTDTVHTGVLVDLSNLQVGANEYDKFVYRFSQNGTEVLVNTFRSSFSSKSFTLRFTNSDYLGNNWFAPGTTYSVTVDCYYNGVAYPVGPATFKTDSISPPSGSIAPTVYTTIKTQGSYGNCVAMSLSTAMEIFKAKAVGTSGSFENFSVSYIYGSDGESSEYMNYEEAVENCISYGSPRWELVTTSFPDSKSKSASVSLFKNACGLAKNNAQKQAFTGSRNIDFYDCNSVANAIQTYGYFMFNFLAPNNFYNIPSTGIVPQPSGGFSGAGHSIALIGLTNINGKPHWIAQNGWGTWWGKNGICYIPYDWGCGVQSPRGPGNTLVCGWTSDCYSVWNSRASASNPGTPTITKATQNGKETNATLTWSNPTSGAVTLIYARKKGTIDWWPKPAYGSPFSGNSGIVSFNKDAAVYELMAISNYNNYLSLQSDIVTVAISIFEPFDWTYAGLNSSTGNRVSGSTKLQGYGLYVTAVEWNELVGKVNEVCGTSIGTVKSGNAISATVVNQVATALGVTKVSQGSPIRASFFNSLRTAYNNII